MTSPEIYQHVIDAEKATEETEIFVEHNFKEVRKSILAIDRAYTKLEAERDELKASASKWRELMELIGGNETWQPMYIQTHYSMLFARPFGYPAARPRIITADELLEGQYVVVKNVEQYQYLAGEVIRNAETDHQFAVRPVEPGAWYEIPSDATIALLADAPESEKPRKVTVRKLRPRFDGDMSTITRITPLKMPVKDAGRRDMFTPPEKPERRGEVIEPEDLRVGDVVDGVTEQGNFSVQDMTITRIIDGVAHDGDKHWNFPLEGGWSEIRLVHRPEPKPELPSRPGEVVLVTEFKGEALDEPLLASLAKDALGDLSWMLLSGGRWPSQHLYALPMRITGWRKARIVVEDGAQ